MSTDPAVWDLIREGVPPTADSVREAVATEAAVLGHLGTAQAESALVTKVMGSGPLQPFVDDPEVTDVLVNGVRGVWIDRGRGLERAECEVGGPDAVRRLAVRLAGHAGRRLDDTCPYVDGLLPGGIRLHAMLPPLVEEAAHISLRVPRRHAPTLAELGGLGCFPTTWAGVVTGIVQARLSFLVTGGTGSGKTTLLAALLAAVDPGERLVVVEDVRELAVAHPHVVRLQARQPNVEGRGAVGMVDLVRQSLRMRPDRLVVGEVRGAELREMLSALNTGHDGGAGTLHANGIADVIARCEALGALAGLGPSAVRTQLASAVRVVVHLRRSGELRYIESIGLLRRAGETGLVVREALTALQSGSWSLGPGWPELAGLLGVDAAVLA